jgi:hypothetical protein
MLISPSFWSPWQPDRLSGFSWVILTVSVALPVLAFLLIGLLRIAGRRARVSQALRALALVSWGWVLLVLLDRASSYGLSVPAHGALAALLRSGGVAVTIGYLASVARRGTGRRFFAAWAVAVAVVLAGFHAAGRLAARQTGMPQVDYEVNVPIAGVTGPASDLERYLEGMRTDFGRAERQAAEDRRRSQTPPP